MPLFIKAQLTMPSYSPATSLTSSTSDACTGKNIVRPEHCVGKLFCQSSRMLCTQLSSPCRGDAPSATRANGVKCSSSRFVTGLLVAAHMRGALWRLCTSAAFQAVGIFPQNLRHYSPVRCTTIRGMTPTVLEDADKWFRR